MTPITADRLAELTLQALERTAFLMGDVAEFDSAAFAATSRAAAIRYSGAAAGSVTLHAGDGFMRSLASSLLGVEPEEVRMDSHGQDAIKELTNIIAGSVIADLGGVNQAFSLGLPELLAKVSVSNDPGASYGVRCCLDCEGHLLFVSWTPSTAQSLAA